MKYIFAFVPLVFILFIPGCEKTAMPEPVPFIALDSADFRLYDVRQELQGRIFRAEVCVDQLEKERRPKKKRVPTIIVNPHAGEEEIRYFLDQ